MRLYHGVIELLYGLQLSVRVYLAYHQFSVSQRTRRRDNDKD